MCEQRPIRTRRPRTAERHLPDGSVIAPRHSNWLFRVQVECPQLALTVTLHEQEGLVAVSDHHLEDLAVLSPGQDPVGLPADTAY